MNPWQKHGRSITFLPCQFGDKIGTVTSATVLLFIIVVCFVLFVLSLKRKENHDAI